MPKTSAQARPANLGQTLRRLLSYMGHAKFSLLAVGVLASVAAIASLAGTYMVRPIVNGLATGGEELLGPGDTIRVTPGVLHDFYNVGDAPAVVLAVTF